MTVPWVGPGPKAPALYAIYQDHFAPGNPPELMVSVGPPIFGTRHEAWLLIVNDKGELQWPASPSPET